MALLDNCEMMKDWEYNVAMILSVVCLVMAIWVIGTGRSNEKLQAKLQAQQVEIDRGNVSRQVGNRIVQDMVAAGATNREMRAVLQKYGMTPQTVPAVSGSGPAKPASSATRSKGKEPKGGSGK